MFNKMTPTITDEEKNTGDHLDNDFKLTNPEPPCKFERLDEPDDIWGPKELGIAQEKYGTPFIGEFLEKSERGVYKDGTPMHAYIFRPHCWDFPADMVIGIWQNYSMRKLDELAQVDWTVYVQCDYRGTRPVEGRQDMHIIRMSYDPESTKFLQTPKS